MDNEVAKAILDNPATPGIAGSALATFYFMPGDTIVAKIGNFIAGGAFTWFVAPFTIEYLSLKTQAAQSFVSFSVGMVGLAISIAVWSWLKLQLGELKWQDLIPWLKKGQ
jgi:ABC-type Na+ efflux pump permease subunit